MDTGFTTASNIQSGSRMYIFFCEQIITQHSHVEHCHELPEENLITKIKVVLYELHRPKIEQRERQQIRSE